MLRLLRRCFERVELLLYRHKVNDALALHHRGEARNDGLILDNVTNRLEIRWRARDIHPWDRHRSHYERETIFEHQTLADTEAAIRRLFERLPHIDVMEVRVIEPTSEMMIAEGTVYRSDFNAVRSSLRSVGMRLREMGMRYSFAVPEPDQSDAMASTEELCVR